MLANHGKSYIQPGPFWIRGKKLKIKKEVE
jgi:hypothetical protein